MNQDTVYVDVLVGQQLLLCGQATYSITEKADLTLGLRYTEDEEDAFLFNENSGLSREVQLSADESWDNLSYLINDREDRKPLC